MKILTVVEIKELIKNPVSPAVSIYLPTIRSGKEIRQNPVRLKNLLKKAKAHLEGRGFRPAESEELLKPAWKLLSRPFFWQRQNEGLALFIAPAFFRYYRLPIRFEELLTVTDRFHVIPLFRVLSGSGRFFLLAFSRHRVRLMEGTRFTINELELPDVPESLEDALRIDSPQKQLQFHTGTAGGPGNRPAIFHGQGAGEVVEREQLCRFLRQIDQGVNRVLAGVSAPLLLAAVESLLPVYGEINTYSNLIEDGITGNPDRLGEEELHNQAWPIMEPYFRRAQNRATEKYHELESKGLAGDGLDLVVPAAYYGRVESLFVEEEIHCWGTFDPGSDRINLSENKREEGNDLVDFATAHTVLNDGQIFTVNREEMPSDSPLAAIFRY